MIYIITILPIIFYVIIIKAMDGFSIASWKRISGWFTWGLFCCGILFFLSRKIKWDMAWESCFVEELLKCLPLIIAINRKKVAFFAEGLIYGTAIGAGFGFLENILYVTLNDGFTFGDAIIRGFGTALLHMGCTALYATIAITVSRWMAHSPRPLTVAACYSAILPSFIIHFSYNMFLLPEFIQMLLVILVMLGLFLIIYSIDNKLIHKWLDSCISNDVSLYGSIREGNLKNTSAGEYLLEIRKRFPPETFFDICVYLGLYLELSINAKSRMIMKEAEMDIPLEENVHKSNMEKLAELESLKKNIGITGLMVLNPIINQKATDEWALEELL